MEQNEMNMNREQEGYVSGAIEEEIFTSKKNAKNAKPYAIGATSVDYASQISAFAILVGELLTQTNALSTSQILTIASILLGISATSRVFASLVWTRIGTFTKAIGQSNAIKAILVADSESINTKSNELVVSDLVHEVQRIKAGPNAAASSVKSSVQF